MITTNGNKKILCFRLSLWIYPALSWEVSVVFLLTFLYDVTWEQAIAKDSINLRDVGSVEECHLRKQNIG